MKNTETPLRICCQHIKLSNYDSWIVFECLKLQKKVSLASKKLKKWEKISKKSKKIFVQWRQERLEHNKKWRTSKVLESLLKSEEKELNSAKSRLESEVNAQNFSMKRVIKGKRNLDCSFPKAFVAELLHSSYNLF